MIRITELKLPIGHSDEELRRKVAKMLRCREEDFSCRIRRQSLDARHKDDKRFVYTLDISLPEEKKLIRKIRDPHITLAADDTYTFPGCGQKALPERPVIVGTGPAGLFCGWYLARAGFRPLLLERGEEAEKRQKTVEAFWQQGSLRPDSNVQFGEGGAGTFSDGKLNTLVKDPKGRNGEVLRRFVSAGAPEEILYQQKPHLGTDVLIRLVTRLRQEIVDMGGEVRFGAKVSDLILSGGECRGVVLADKEKIPCGVLILAIGHSARDTFSMLHERGLHMEPKAFAVGLRMEHPQSLINLSQYGEEENPLLGPASYKLTYTTKAGRGVYSFCMCPGGYVVNASSEEGMLAVNGMSYQKRDSGNANSALVVTVSPEDFGEEGPLGGIAFQRRLERAAYLAAKGKVPVQTWEDFSRQGKNPEPLHVLGKDAFSPRIKGAYEPVNLYGILPDDIRESLREAIPVFATHIPGFDMPGALLSGVESRTSSPVRICRSEALLSNIGNIYPCGEGAGYAGGITSAAMDGLKVAEAIAQTYHAYNNIQK